MSVAGIYLPSLDQNKWPLFGLLLPRSDTFLELLPYVWWPIVRFLSSFVEAELLALSLSDVSFEYLALLVDFPSAITKRDAENPQISEPIQEKSCQL